jgi:hypothetical protein
MQGKYAKRDAEMAKFIADSIAARQNYRPPQILRCSCGAAATVAETRKGGTTKLYCAVHENLASLD